jgi:phytoene synthase
MPPRSAPKPDRAIRADLDACRSIIRQGSRSFHTASLLLPASVRVPACAIYAFCRLSDDAVDGPDARADAIADLRERLDLAYHGRPRAHPVDRAFADVVARYEIPKALPAALLDGLEWDQRGFEVETLSDLYAYAARVAGAVGAMMTVLMGVRDPATLARACDLGVAMQLTNIARDIGEDARNGRVYLPRTWLRHAGLDRDAWLAAPVFDERIALVTSWVLALADELYDRARPGIAGLPVACRPAIEAARQIYREIGRDISAHGFDSISRRAIVPHRRKLELVAVALGRSAVSTARSSHPALDETQFLVDAVGPLRWAGRPNSERASFDQRVGWVIDLFGDLDARDRYEWSNSAGSSPAAE